MIVSGDAIRKHCHGIEDLAAYFDAADDCSSFAGAEVDQRDEKVTRSDALA